MKIIKQGSLILLLAAFSFFSSAISAALDEQPIKAWVEPKVQNSSKFKCTTNQGGSNPFFVKQAKECIDKTYARHAPGSTIVSCALGTFQYDYNYISCRQEVLSWNGSTIVSYFNFGRFFPAPLDDGTSKICPPDDFPEYRVGPVPESPENPTHEVCKMNFTPCPLGFYANSVADSSGGPEKCVPINCPSKGTAVTNIKNLTNVIPNGAAGTYCDGLCNYSIEAGGIAYQGQQFASGVSMGSQCGQSPVKGQKFTPLDKEKNCTEYDLQGADATFLECNEGTIDEPVPDTDNPAPDVENAKVDENPVIDPFTGVECTTVDDKMSCVGKNITDALTKQTKDDAKLAAERHNKLVEQQKDITAYVEEQQRKREDARKNDAVTMVEAIQEVNRTLQTSGGSTGGGTTGGTDEGVKGAIESLGEGINGTDVETDSTPSDGIASFYEPEYPNGFQDVWSKNKSLFDNSEMNQYLDSWKLSASGNPPIMNACFNMGFIDFGCNEFTIDPRIFPFLRIIMLVSAAFLCRALIFGG